MRRVAFLVTLSIGVFARAEEGHAPVAVSPVPTAEDPRAPGPLSPDAPPTGPDRRPVTAPVHSTMAPLEPTRQPEGPLPWAGYQHGSFFLRDPHDWFVVYPKGRLQIDGYVFANRGTSPPAGITPNDARDPRPKDTVFVRRARVELFGTVIGHFDFEIAAEYASAPSTGQTGIVSDAFVIVDYLPYLKLQLGQFDAPFSMENRTSDKYIDSMERSAAVRGFGVPLNKDQGGMLWGWLPKRLAYYSVGVFDGDGGSFKNQDNHPAVVGRAFVAPLATFGGKRPWIEQLWVGGSVWWKDAVNQGGPATPNVGGAAQNDYPTFTTQGGVPILQTSYGNGVDADGHAVRSHLAPWGRTLRWAVEANVPLFNRLGARFELMHNSVALARYDDSNTVNATLVRSAGQRGGLLEGLGWYVELYGWILGDSTFLETPGIGPMPRLKRGAVPPPRWGLMLAVKYEHLRSRVSGIAATPAGGVDPVEGRYAVDVIEAGLNAWGTKHVRITANYVMNYIRGDSAQVRASYFYGRPEHEVLFRVGLNP